MKNIGNQPPALAPGQPVYPPLLQLLRVTAATVPGPAGVSQVVGSSVPGPTLYVAFTEQLTDDSLLPRDREPCLADDVNGLGLTPGYYLGRLAEQFNGLPVYEVMTLATSSGAAAANFGSSSGVGFTCPGALSIIPGYTTTGTILLAVVNGVCQFIPTSQC